MDAAASLSMESPVIKTLCLFSFSFFFLSFFFLVALALVWVLGWTILSTDSPHFCSLVLTGAASIHVRMLGALFLALPLQCCSQVDAGLLAALGGSLLTLESS